MVEETESETKENPEIMDFEGGVVKKKVEFSEGEPSPRGVLENPALSGTESDHSGSSSGTCNSSSPNEKSMAHQALENQGMQWKSMFGALKKKSVRRFSTIPLLAAGYEISRKNLRRKLARIGSFGHKIDDCEGFPDLVVSKPTWRNFDYAELDVATANFNPENLVGKGGQAEVYKGCLADGQLVAVKRLTKKQKENEDRIADFLSELGIIAHTEHPNVARLFGFGIDGGLHLVLEFSPYGSLASLLFGSTECMEWKVRFKVAVGVAEGLQYLHHDCHRRIIHRDIKASNILLTENYEAQISDFGLAKWLPEKWSHHVVFPIEGTFGYLAPEYFMHGIVDEKTDVFAYGVLLLELITGRRAVDSSQQSLVIWAKPLLDNNNFKELVDPQLGDAFDHAEMKRTMMTASMCIHHQSTKRPFMNRVVRLLKDEDGPVELKQKSTAVRSLILDACDLEDYTCSSYLSDLHRHRQLVME
ncbi:hypothetical protein FNV43_RR17469 [Rhamnella rubrinervis]|uniref:non-specific serine/threonine protein kinase n=1 Tax=Rhamnella rubrinervis TaxID=2594499 RepID=A0A8K0GUV8_9ROSA|nr:hypothetical protein FNV43_RR17469 [Rhamnella rubrinervis]